MKVRPGAPGRVAPAPAGAGIVCSRSTIPTDGRGALGPFTSVFPRGSGVGADEGPGFVFELEEVDDFDGSGFLWATR